MNTSSHLPHHCPSSTFHTYPCTHVPVLAPGDILYSDIKLNETSDGQSGPAIPENGGKWPSSLFPERSKQGNFRRPPGIRGWLLLKANYLQVASWHWPPRKTREMDKGVVSAGGTSAIPTDWRFQK